MGRAILQVCAGASAGSPCVAPRLLLCAPLQSMISGLSADMSRRAFFCVCTVKVPPRLTKEQENRDDKEAGDIGYVRSFARDILRGLDAQKKARAKAQADAKKKPPAAPAAAAATVAAAAAEAVPAKGRSGRSRKQQKQLEQQQRAKSEGRNLKVAEAAPDAVGGDKAATSARTVPGGASLGIGPGALAPIAVAFSRDREAARARLTAAMAGGATTDDDLRQLRWEAGSSTGMSVLSAALSSASNPGAGRRARRQAAAAAVAAAARGADGGAAPHGDGDDTPGADDDEADSAGEGGKRRGRAAARKAARKSRHADAKATSAPPAPAVAPPALPAAAAAPAPPADLVLEPDVELALVNALNAVAGEALHFCVAVLPPADKGHGLGGGGGDLDQVLLYDIDGTVHVPGLVDSADPTAMQPAPTDTPAETAAKAALRAAARYRRVLLLANAHDVWVNLQLDQTAAEEAAKAAGTAADSSDEEDGGAAAQRARPKSKAEAAAAIKKQRKEALARPLPSVPTLFAKTKFDLGNGDLWRACLDKAAPRGTPGEPNSAADSSLPVSAWTGPGIGSAQNGGGVFRLGAGLDGSPFAGPAPYLPLLKRSLTEMEVQQLTTQVRRGEGGGEPYGDGGAAADDAGAEGRGGYGGCGGVWDT